SPRTGASRTHANRSRCRAAVPMSRSTRLTMMSAHGRTPARHASRPVMTSTAELTSPASADRPGLDSFDADYTLEHRYTRHDGRIYLSGVQALVRLPLMQQLRDAAAGLDTAGFISGYRGSPLGGF